MIATRWPALLLLALSSIAGCGGGSKPTPQAPDPSQGEGPAEDGEDSAGAQPDAAGNPGAPLDESECTQLADHLVDLSLAAKRELRQSLKPACAALPRRDFSCAMAAHTSAELGACQK